MRRVQWNAIDWHHAINVAAIPVYPSSAMNAALYDYELIPNGCVICHRDIVSEWRMNFNSTIKE